MSCGGNPSYESASASENIESALMRHGKTNPAALSLCMGSQIFEVDC